jgi:hypothetical protein
MENTGKTLQLTLHMIKFRESKIFQVGYVGVLRKKVCEDE